MTLVTAPFEATLTGSRFFGAATAASDYDFFTADVYDENVDGFQQPSTWLKKHGWKLIIEESYTDQNTEAVFRRGCVDVTLVKNYDLRVKVQEYLKLHFPALYQMEKPLRKQVWKYSYALLGM